MEVDAQMSDLTDGYGLFLSALRGWIGIHGVDTLAMSFYSTLDGASGWIRDASTFPLLATLHYVIRANGCVRVLETGTCRGVSAACIASAIAHRDGARVVTFDPATYAKRHELWNGLPPAMRASIDERTTDSIEGMTAALAAGERFHAALLDSDHSEEHLLAEFGLARQLVCQGGLILAHDSANVGVPVARALRRIESQGYNVVRLWEADEGEREDDGLGLAIIENRPRS